MNKFTLSLNKQKTRIHKFPHKFYRRVVLFNALIVMSFITYAQPSFHWAKQFGGPDAEEGNSVTVDVMGNVYATGSFSGTTDFDPGPGVHNLTSVGPWDIYVTKLDASGNFVWAKSMGGTDNDNALAITVDSLSNIYLTGYFWGTADFNPDAGVTNLTSNGDYDIFLVKLNSSGNLQWAKNIGGIDRDLGNAITLDNIGNIYLTGYFNDVVDFDPGAGTNNLTANNQWADIYVTKFDNSGNLIWARGMGGTYIDIGRGVTVDASGNVYTTGWFTNTVDFDPGAGTFNLSSFGLDDVFIQKLDASGNFVWAGKIGGSGYDRANGITSDYSGNIYITGSIQDTVDFDPGAGTFTLTGGGIFVAKYSTAGSLVWAKVMEITSGGGGFYGNVGNSIKLDVPGNVAVTGSFAGIVDFDPSNYQYLLPSAGSDDIFVLKLSSIGNFICAGRIGGTGSDISNSIATDTASNMIITGRFESTVDFDPGSGTTNLTAGGYEAFVAKLGTCSTLGVKENTDENNLAAYPNPNNGQFVLQVNSVAHTEGVIEIRLFNVTGQEIYHAFLNVDNNQKAQAIVLPTTVAEGIYQLNLKVGSDSYNKQIMVVR